MRLDLRNQKITPLLTAIKISLIIQSNKLNYRSVSRARKFACFPSKRLNKTVTNSSIHKLSTLTIAKLTTYTKTDIKLHIRVKHLKTFMVSSKFDSDCFPDKSNIHYLKTCIVRTRSFQGNLACSKRHLMISTEKIIYIQNARPRLSCAFSIQKTKKKFLTCDCETYNFS